MNLNGGLQSTLEVGTGDGAGGRIVFGANGINPNPVGESVDDADIFPNNVETLTGAGEPATTSCSPRADREPALR